MDGRNRNSGRVAASQNLPVIGICVEAQHIGAVLANAKVVIIRTVYLRAKNQSSSVARQNGYLRLKGEITKSSINSTKMLTHYDSVNMIGFTCKSTGSCRNSAFRPEIAVTVIF